MLEKFIRAPACDRLCKRLSCNLQICRCLGAARRIRVETRGGNRTSSVVARKLTLHSSLADEARTEPLAPAPVTPVSSRPGAIAALAGDPADLVSFVEEGRRLPHGAAAGRKPADPAHLPGRRRRGRRGVPSAAQDGQCSRAITRCSRFWLVPKSRLAALPRTVGGLAEAFLREATVNAEAAREWIVNLGAARLQIGADRPHLICELCTRMDGMGCRAARCLYPFPFTQRDIADAQGLSVVHVKPSC